MVYDHMVKVNGQYYATGKDVPDVEMAEDESSLPFSDDDITLETKEVKQYTKSDINRMSKAELQELVRNIGVEDADEMTGQEMKEYLFNLFGL